MIITPQMLIYTDLMSWIELIDTAIYELDGTIEVLQMEIFQKNAYVSLVNNTLYVEVPDLTGKEAREAIESINRINTGYERETRRIASYLARAVQTSNKIIVGTRYEDLIRARFASFSQVKKFYTDVVE